MLLQMEEETEAKREQSKQQSSKGLDLNEVCQSLRPDLLHHALRLDSHHFLWLPRSPFFFLRDIDLTCNTILCNMLT